MSQKEKYQSIIRRFYNGTASDKDMQLIQKMMDDAEFLAAWEEVWSISVPAKPSANTADQEKLFDKVMHDERVIADRTIHAVRHSNRYRRLWRYAGAVAMFLLTIAIAFWVYHDPKKEALLVAEQQNEVEEVLPGKERAMIVLNNGKSIDLEALPGDTTLQMEGFCIHKSRDGIISYQADKDYQTAGRLVYNRIVTPKGGEYALLLPDGTKVWLNAVTTLRYPVVFDDKERVVQMEGEAYFEVSKAERHGKRIPFIVETGKQRLEVLGTVFNLNTYTNDLVTTLVEGKVKLSFSGTDAADKILEANDQVRFDREKERYTYAKVDPLYFTSWKNGNFAFSNTDVHQVMEDIARWYDIEVIYKLSSQHIRFSGRISRYENIDKMLELIAMTGEVRFKREGRRVYVLDE
ncbi:FecR family protein [Sphingobacterium gobiense]|uniref:Anti-sigma factor n=1 Tax=Sphingobacterium gobiense TaxID=1382456 RepID=A0A2S9JRY2_9SPHI|nr:FecR family protein [Sphingobacterium gobiense]PRD56065.1 hypothetical protein C5749_01895 [Sphingobacterium gobiense]